MQEAWDKYDQLIARLQDLKSVVLAFSGGVDSTFLLQAALTALGRENVLAVTADSETYPEREREAAIELARELGAKHVVLQTSELNIPGYAENPVNRCYFCKNELFSHLIPIAHQDGLNCVVFGAIADDFGDYRPGLQAAKDRGVIAPLQDVMLYKREIRYLSKELGLSTWDKPSLACLSSRIPYGELITQSKLSMVDQAEFFLSQLGFRQVRVRHHNDTARIEVPRQDIVNVASVAELVTTKLVQIGYRYVTLDLEGYRTGSLNEALEANPSVQSS
ncbi:ATP-dependent sacrificial sulfur transferase LarE [Alicyclobacillus fastidiosus]|uniref:ATP-dependent sacrificial sulfur transferase LarE n=1 Tax=Alicyclobacillus fastidiosus TaxID=392011 RepID=A0ABY6ZH72_9BACL|nr:ATP-dependent sacrificial sulfur transferase LarE [Alicyclobacillus fastidiosus]WAH42070.1 ATP-dependent sacrificial sulfur transferase LarE [Alicyclobacillus fastidiosus]GMA63833.1 adenine nucleotide alpha hydrolase [Alicyclobacillus fastidiosus]